MRIKMKKLLSLLMAVVMILSLAACGGKEEAKEQEETPEFVYTAEFTPLVSDDKNYLSPQIFTDEGFYATCSEKVGENIPEGVVPEYEGQYDVYENRLYFIGYDGSRTRLTDYVPLPAKENTEGYKEFYSGSSLNGMLMGADGNLVVIEVIYSNWYDGPENLNSIDEEYWNYFRYTQEYYIRSLDSKGNELSCAPIQVEENEYLNTWRMQLDEKGNLLVSTDMGLRAIAPDGSDAYRIDSDFYIDSIAKLSDGRVGALNWGENGMQLSLIDSETKAFGENIPMPYDAYNMYTGGGEYDFYYTSGINFYGYDIESQESSKLFNWINCDVNGDELSQLKVNEDGSITGIINSWDNDTETYSTDLVTLKKVPYSSVPHKETVTMAVMYLDWEVRDEVIKFNRSHDDVRIEIIDYSEYNTEEDYSAGLTKLSTEIMAGNMPDIISLSELPYAQLAAKGLLEDLYPYIDADKDFSRDDFFGNVLGALEVDGKLYSTCPSFSIQTLIGASSVVGDTPGWTYDEYYAALASMPEGCDPMDPYVTQSEMLSNCVYLEMNELVDWTTGQCRFDSQEFVDLLEFVGSFPKEFDWENYDYSNEDSTEVRIAQGRQMLMSASIYSFEDVMYNDIYFGGKSTYIGYPTNSGSGNMMSLGQGYAMSSKCENKEAAWDFLRIFFTEEYQNSIWSLPTNINVYEKKLKDAMTPEYMTDAEGNYVLDEEGNKVEMSRGGIGLGDGSVVEFYALTQEQADKLWEVVTTTTKAANYNASIFDIVNEQAQAYFEGQKSAQEVAKLIQSKANIYVNEQR